MSESEKLQQIKQEYDEGRSFLETKKQRWVRQLTLMNNLKRGDENISSTMLFSFFNRVHSNLYDSKISVKFLPSEDSEYKRTEALNKLAINDYREMDKAQLDYDWLWDTLFFSRGYLETLNFDKKRKLLKPTVINPLMFYYDPYFSDVQSWRYYGKWITRSGSEISRMIKNELIKGIRDPKDIVSGIDPQIWDYKTKRDSAKDANSPGADSRTTPTGNNVYQILEHYTYFDNKKTIVWTDRDITKILREEELKLEDDPDNVDESKWPIVVKEVFREPHSSVSISVPDLVEDKHRAENVILNLAYIAAKDEVTPIYAYNVDALEDPSQLFQRQINQHIPVSGDPTNVVSPIKKSSALSNSSLQLLSILKSESAEAIGTTMISGPIQRGKKTATGEALLQQVADLTASLQSKILGNSEAEFWSHWYQRYINNSKEGDQKIVTATNVSGVTFEAIQLDEIKTKYPPKVLVLSSKEAEFKEMVERRELAQQFGVLQAVLPPEKFVLMLKHQYFPKYQTFDSETIDLIIPKSVDEIKAEQENEMLNDGQLPLIDPNDDDEVHLYVHARAKRTAETWAHIHTHEKQLAEKKGQQNNPAPEQGSNDKSKAKDMNENEAATPLKGSMEKVGKESKINSNIKK